MVHSKSPVPKSPVRSPALKMRTSPRGHTQSAPIRNPVLVDLPGPSCSSPQSRKRKAISDNLKKSLSKKRKQKDKGKEIAVQPNHQGLKLLNRGCVTMHRIVQRKIKGIKPIVSFNDKGEPFGDEAAEMQSYIGVLARTKAPIWHDSWLQVPKETKKKLWECVKVTGCLFLVHRFYTLIVH